MGVVSYSVWFWYQPLTGRKMTCTDCGHHGYIYRSDDGNLCLRCCRQHREAHAAEHEQAWRCLAAAYHLDGDDFIAQTFIKEGLANSSGKVRIKPAGSKPRMRLLWHPDPAALVRHLSPTHVGLQIQTVARIAWAMSLRFGARMVDIEVQSPRGGHYCHTEIQWLTVEWAASHVTHWWWLAAYIDALCADYVARTGKPHRSLTPERRAFYARHIGDAIFDGRLTAATEAPTAILGALRAVHLPATARRAA